MKEMKPGQTVCNERNEKGKLCAGPLKRRPDPKYRSKTEIAGANVVYRCGRCYTLYEGPPIGFLRDVRMKEYVMAVAPDIAPPEPKPPAAHEPAKKEAPPGASE
ncbi:MAG: hypothetical protein KF868_19910 [Acidobacteria bacterium]|nr:hypothetical protein [Acidobacteriota bacterium]MCW5971542.1 hypothetical protein [Blastocatellales bacterium]